MSQKIPLMQIVAGLIDQDDRSEHYFRRLYRIAVRGAQKFHRDIYGNFRSVLLPVAANHTVAWPCDYLDYSKLGIINEQGEVISLRHNEDLSLLRQQYLASQQKIVPVPKTQTTFAGGIENPQAYPFFWLNYQWSDSGWMHLYGVGGGAPSVGEFTVDPANKCFYVPHYFPYGTIMLEYLSDGFSEDGQDYMVDIYAQEALEWWIRWQSAVGLPKKYSLGQVNYYQKEWLVQRREARVRLNHARINEMIVIARGQVKLTARA